MRPHQEFVSDLEGTARNTAKSLESPRGVYKSLMRAHRRFVNQGVVKVLGREWKKSGQLGLEGTAANTGIDSGETGARFAADDIEGTWME